MKFKEKLINASSDFTKLSIIFIFIILLSRIHEIIMFGTEHSFNGSDILIQTEGFLFDFIFSLRLLLLLYIIFLIFSFIHLIFARIIFFIISSIIILSNLSLISYFKYSLIPLGNDLFGYSFEEIKHTVNTSGGSSIKTYSLMFLIYALFLFLSIMIMKINISKRTSGIMILLIFFISLLTPALSSVESYFGNDFNYYLAVNKTEYFLMDIFNNNKNKDLVSGDIKNIKPGDSKNDFEYISKEYPLLHKENTPDVLSSFFNKSNIQPNLVFIIVESLGRAYCGPNAYLGSFTPYVDSLIQHSLYWENFLSTGGRTFAVFPSLFGSLPFGEKGFLELNDKMPSHQSLLKILKNDGYTTRFYYGGDSHFDLMDNFMHKQNIDKIYDNSNFGSGYLKLPPNKEGFAWGYGDKEIFRKCLEVLKNDSHKPRVDIFMTLAMHSPFLIPNQNYYNTRFEKRMTEIGLKENVKTERRSYHQNYECIMYFDDALKYFITEYSKRDDYKNTIFIITGDHRMPEIPIATQIDRFHVPLIVFSPMLKKSKKFSSVSTQFDVTPTLLSYLHKSYNIKTPEYTAWLGHGLDISNGYNKNRSYPLMRNKNELVDYLDGSYLLSKNDVYKLYDNMDIEKTQNQSKHDAIKKKLENFIAINTYVCSKNKIIPDSLNNEIDVNKAEEAKSPEVKSVNKNKSDLSENISNTKPNNKEFNGKFKSIDKQLKWLKENNISYIYNNSGNNKDFKTEYFIVAGSFKKSSNAEGFVEILKGKGMKSEIVFNTELKLYHVYTFKYTDMFTAIKKLHEAQNDEKYNKQALLFIN